MTIRIDKVVWAAISGYPLYLFIAFESLRQVVTGPHFRGDDRLRILILRKVNKKDTAPIRAAIVQCNTL